VPGTDGGAGGTGAAAGGSGSASAGGGAGGESTVGLDPASAEVPDTGNTSVAGNVALLAVIAALAALVGVFVARRRRLGTR
jgi:LPXTG-motif cell wall-anchored protein